MGQPDLAANTAAPAEPEPEPGESMHRGLFGRLVEAFAPPPPPPDTPQGASGPGQPAPGILNLRRMRVEEVMIPKAEIVATPLTSSREELIEVFRDSGLTRLPVFDGTLDTPVGLAHLKDLALKYGFNGDQSKSFSLSENLRPLLYVPPSMPLGVLLQKMQTSRTHMALVIDEYGGTDGLLTIEDLIEQVVGEIEDEHDADEVATYIEEKPGVWLALAKTELDDFEPEVGIDLRAHEEIDREEVDTLGGLVVMIAGKVPSRGEVIEHPSGPEFEVIDADPRRIKRVRVRLTPKAKS